MSWAVGFDSQWDRDIGYGVPAYCDHPGCGKEIDRGLAVYAAANLTVVKRDADYFFAKNIFITTHSGTGN